MPTPHDHLFHFAFAAPASAGRLLRHVLPVAVWRSLAFRTAVPWPQKRVDPSLRVLYCDQGFRTTPRGRTPRHVVVEHKSGPDRFVGLQVHGYELQTWRDERRLQPKAQHLPPVVAVVVHHGRRYRGPTDLGELVAPFPVPWRWPFTVVDLSEFPEAELLRWPLSPFERLVLLCLQHVRGRRANQVQAALRRWSSLLRQLSRSASARDCLQALSSYILETTDLSLARLEATLASIVGDREVNMITTAERIRRKARKEGRQEGRIELLLRLLAARFGPLPEATEVLVRDASAETIDQWAEEVLTAKTLKQLLNGHAAPKRRATRRAR